MTDLNASRSATFADLMYRLTEIQSDLVENGMREAAAAAAMALGFVIEGSTYEFSHHLTESRDDGNSHDGPANDDEDVAMPLRVGGVH